MRKDHNFELGITIGKECKLLNLNYISVLEQNVWYTILDNGCAGTPGDLQKPTDSSTIL
jgi:hypothetical protein